MIPFEEIDRRLDALSKDRKWLAEVTGRSPDSIRAALAPNAHPKQRSGLLQKALSDAIEREAEAQTATKAPQQPGFHNVFLDDDQIVRADLASRKINAPSLVDFCRDAITHRADELLAGREDPVPHAPAALASVGYPPNAPNALEYQRITPQPLASVAESIASHSTHAAGAQPVKYPSARRRKV